MANKVVLLKDVLLDAQSGDILGISDRNKIIRYIERALEIVEFKSNWNRYIGDIDICSDSCGFVTLPSFVDTVLAVNICGRPGFARNSWFEYHINGPGSNTSSLGVACTYTWDDKMWSPTFQDPKGWVLLGAICEDARDGDGTKFLHVMGETMDGSYNAKDALTPTTDGYDLGVKIPLLNGYASVDPQITQFRKITRVIKPQTNGYVKLIAYTPGQNVAATTLGYYAPWETQPSFRRIKVGRPNAWIRVRFRRVDTPLKNDYDVVPLPSRQVTLDLLKAVRLRETNNIDIAEAYESKAVQLLTEIQQIEDGPGTFNIQVDPGSAIGTLDWR